MLEAELREIAEGLWRADVSYLLLGPLAVAAHGCMPYTRGMDCCLLFESDDQEKGIRALAGIGFLPADQFDRAREGGERPRRTEDREFLDFVRLVRTTGGIEIHMARGFPLDFRAMHARALQLDLARVPLFVCGYADLVRLKRQSGRSQDLVDLDQLEKVRRTRPAYDPWYASTFEGSELWGLWRWSNLSFKERLRSLEGSMEVCRTFQKVLG